MARIGAGCIVIGVTGRTGCWCTIIVTVVTLVACNVSVYARKRPVGVVICCRCPV